MSDAARPLDPEATATLAADLLRGLRHDLNNRSNLLSLSLPTLQAAVAQAVAAARSTGGIDATVAGLPVDEAEEELGWLLGMLTERDETAGAHVDALQRAMGTSAPAPLAGLIEDLELLCGHALKRLGLALAPPDAPGPAPEMSDKEAQEGPRTQLTRWVARLLLNAPAGLAGHHIKLTLHDGGLLVDLPLGDLPAAWREPLDAMAPWTEGLKVQERTTAQSVLIELGWPS